MAVDAKSEALQARIIAAVLPQLAAQGYELVLLEYSPRSRVLRAYIDRLSATREGSVGIDDCTQVTRWLSDFLDAEGYSDLIPGAYTLEVSSPGLDRPLVQPAHYCRFVGREATVVLREAPPAEKGRRKFRGRIAEAVPDASGGIRLEIEGRALEMPYASIERANLVPDV